jgi:hypothetical protein|tara:strand:+ start:278 stop:691 length:414 start_codon:yes stop_codon:yes gene_type:complete
MGVVQTQAETIAVLTAQLFIRVLLLLVAVSLLGSTPALRAGQLDSLMLAFRNFFAMQLMAILVCLFLRVCRSALEVPLWQGPSSAPVPPRGALFCSGQLGSLRGEAGPLGAQPLPRVLGLAASKAADFAAFGHSGTA